MSYSRDPLNIVSDFVSASISGEPTDAEVAEFQQVLRENEDARQLYADLIELSVQLPRVLVGVLSKDEAAGQQPSEDYEPAGSSDATFLPPSACFSPSAAFYSPLGGILFSYLVAAVIMGAGLWVASAWKLSAPVETAGGHSGPNAASHHAVASRESVGRITGMVNCVWGSSGERGPSISLGDRFVLRSGLLEMTYDTGARVVLQGPVTYAVDSTVGGYLAVGKLTAKLEKSTERVVSAHWSVASEGNRSSPDKRKRMGGEGGAGLPTPFGREAGSEGGSKRSDGNQTQTALTLALSQGERGPQSAASSLSTLPSPLFTITTPTAVVTDLGTEFGVEVDAGGNTTCAVFQGKVHMVRMAGSVLTGNAMQLRQGEAAQVVASGTGIVASSYKPSAFVRSIASASPARALIGTVEKRPTWWRYVTQRPKGDWTQPDFDDSWWPMGKASFGCAGLPGAKLNPNRLYPRPTIVTGWVDQDLWLRQVVVVKRASQFARAVLTVLHDSDIEVFVNGHRIHQHVGSHEGYAAVDVTEALRAAIKDGANTVAAHVRGKDDLYQAFDLGLTLDPKDDCLPARAMKPADLKGKRLVLIPAVGDGAAEWQWTTEQPDGSWREPVAAGVWKTGKAGFGVTDQNVSAAMVGTPWKTNDLWLRKAIDVGDLPRDYRAILEVFHDDDVEVFVNGTLVFAEPGFLSEMKAVDITDPLKGVLRKGPNVVAVHVRQVLGGGRYIDLGLSLGDPSQTSRQTKSK